MAVMNLAQDFKTYYVNLSRKRNKTPPRIGVEELSKDESFKIWFIKDISKIKSIFMTKKIEIQAHFIRHKSGACSSSLLFSHD